LKGSVHKQNTRLHRFRWGYLLEPKDVRDSFQCNADIVLITLDNVGNTLLSNGILYSFSALLSPVWEFVNYKAVIVWAFFLSSSNAKHSCGAYKSTYVDVLKNKMQEKKGLASYPDAWRIKMTGDADREFV
ncbi:hypothetical protein ABVT39_006591, partial [Epinephelus coioides]